MSLTVKNMGGERPLTGNADASDVLETRTFYNTDSGNKLTGSMTNNGAISQTINPNSSYTIPKGFHNGNGVVSARKVGASDVTQSYVYEYANEVSNTATNRNFNIATVAGALYVVTVTLLEYVSYGSVSITLTGGTISRSYDGGSHSDDTSFLHTATFVVTANGSSLNVAIGRGRKCTYSVTKIG